MKIRAIFWINGSVKVRVVVWLTGVIDIDYIYYGYIPYT